MTSELVTVWSAAQERTGTARFALTSPLIGSTARMCMAMGSHANTEGPRQKDQPLALRRCRRCLTRFAPPMELRKIKNVVICADCTAKDWGGTR